MANIGFVSYWGFGRGRAYTTQSITKMLKGKHNVYVLQQGSNLLTKEYFGLAHVTVSPTYMVDEDLFRKWITDNKLDAVVLNEYGQWNQEETDLVGIAKELGCKVYGFFVIEAFKKEQAEGFDRVFVQCITVERFMRTNKIRNFTYIPYSIDLKEFDRVKTNPDKFTFLHVGGFGGVHNRKNTQLVIDAFVKLNNPDTKLIVTAQTDYPINVPEGHDIELIKIDLSREELLDVYHRANVAVFPSKWETIGIPILEALATSVPVITCDVPPMNEFVRTGLNGYLVKADLKPYQGISVLGATPDVSTLKNYMETSMNSSVYDMLSRNARFVVEKLYNVDKNKDYILKFLEKDLGEKK